LRTGQYSDEHECELKPEISPYKRARVREHLGEVPGARWYGNPDAMPTNEMVRRLILLREQEDRRSSF
jgi:hypothetical protein